MDTRPLPSTPLYHYTSAQGLHGILTSKTLWATNIYYLNDSQEYDYAQFVANKVVWQRAEVASDQKEKEVLMFLCDPKGIDLRRQPQRLAPPVFVVSFSENGDLLSQWRGYCPSGAGYSIGFNARGLRSVATMEGCGLAPCLYDDELQCDAIEQALDKFMESPSWIRAIEHLGDENARGRVIMEWRTSLGNVAPIIKHPSFREEHEWRLISTTISWGDPRCLVRVGRSMLIPYVKIDLTVLDDHPPVEVVIVGPTPHMLLAQQGVGTLFQSLQLPLKSVENSKIPYRDTI